MSYNQNKQNFTWFLLQEWQKDKYAGKQGRKILFVYDDAFPPQAAMARRCCRALPTREEADTKIILHRLHVAADSPAESTITVRSPDTDVYILFLWFGQDIQQTVLFNTGVANKWRLINVKRVILDIGCTTCSWLPAAHAYSGCDTASTFVSSRKIAHLKLLGQHPEFVHTSTELGTLEQLPEPVFHELERFTCILYGDLTTQDINKLRFEFLKRFRTKQGELLTSYNGVDLSLLYLLAGVP